MVRVMVRVSEASSDTMVKRMFKWSALPLLLFAILMKSNSTSEATTTPAPGTSPLPQKPGVSSELPISTSSPAGGGSDAAPIPQGQVIGAKPITSSPEKMKRSSNRTKDFGSRRDDERELPSKQSARNHNGSSTPKRYLHVPHFEEFLELFDCNAHPKSRSQQCIKEVEQLYSKLFLLKHSVQNDHSEMTTPMAFYLETTPRVEHFVELLRCDEVPDYRAPRCVTTAKLFYESFLVFSNKIHYRKSSRAKSSKRKHGKRIGKTHSSSQQNKGVEPSAAMTSHLSIKTQNWSIGHVPTVAQVLQLFGCDNLVKHKLQCRQTAKDLHDDLLFLKYHFAKGLSTISKEKHPNPKHSNLKAVFSESHKWPHFPSLLHFSDVLSGAAGLPGLRDLADLFGCNDGPVRSQSQCLEHVKTFYHSLHILKKIIAHAKINKKLRLAYVEQNLTSGGNNFPSKMAKYRVQSGKNKAGQVSRNDFITLMSRYFQKRKSPHAHWNLMGHIDMVTKSKENRFTKSVIPFVVSFQSADKRQIPPPQLHTKDSLGRGAQDKHSTFRPEQALDELNSNTSILNKDLRKNETDTSKPHVWSNLRFRSLFRRLKTRKERSAENSSRGLKQVHRQLLTDHSESSIFNTLFMTEARNLLQIIWLHFFFLGFLAIVAFFWARRKLHGEQLKQV